MCLLHKIGVRYEHNVDKLNFDQEEEEEEEEDNSKLYFLTKDNFLAKKKAASGPSAHTFRCLLITMCLPVVL